MRRVRCSAKCEGIMKRGEEEKEKERKVRKKTGRNIARNSRYIYIYITVGSTAFYLQLVSSLMTIADLRARSRDMHRYIRLASCSRLPSFYTYPRIHAIHDTFRADTYVLTNTDNTPCRRGESAKRREIERERERVGEETDGRMRDRERRWAKKDGEDICKKKVLSPTRAPNPYPANGTFDPS